MRIRKNFAERTRTRDTTEAVRKYFLVFEGDATELQYFDGIQALRVQLGIHHLIEIRSILRSYNEMGWTNPKKLLDRVIQYIEQEQAGGLTVASLVHKTVDYLKEEGALAGSIYTPDLLYEMLLEWFWREEGLKGTDEISALEEAAASIVRCLKRKTRITKNIQYISAYLQQQNITYEEGFDKICLIVDRDKDSFVSHPNNDQFAYVRQTCKEKGFGFYLTNPCFEFWLLLHFDEVFQYDLEQLKENPKITNKVRYLENELRRLLPGYKKANIRFELLKKRIWKAVENERHFCEDIDGLKDAVGSNVGLLLQELMGFAALPETGC